MTKICLFCGKEFKTGKLHKKYCSEECAKLSKREQDKLYYKPVGCKTKTCPICGKEFETNHNGSKYCSKDCKMKNWIQVQSERSKARTKICKVCGKEFNPEYNQQKYCSPECRFANKREWNEKYRQTQRGKRLCQWCGKELPKHRSKFCSNKCATRKSHAVETYCNENITLAKLQKLKKKTCKVCGREFIPANRVSGAKVCIDCAKKYHILQSEIPNQCPWCGKYIREGKALCKECYEKEKWRFDKSMVDFIGVEQ